MRTRSQNSVLKADDVCVTIGDKQILVNIRAEARSGDVFAILGPTGSGKTTFLNVVSGRLKSSSGSISLDGQRFTKRERRRLAFVQQQDVFFSQLTLWETLYFTAQLRLPDSLTEAEKKEKIDEIIDTLDLRKCINTLIGDLFTRGLSGGEKKRASVACELLTDPDILLLDEPTSGLDSSTALSLMLMMKEYANHYNKTIVITIHQPSSHIFRIFNNILLIVKGHEAYYGSAAGALDYFDRLGFTCETHFNPADFLLQIAKSDEETIDKVIEAAEQLRIKKDTSDILKDDEDDIVSSNNVKEEAHLMTVTVDVDDKNAQQISLLKKSDNQNSHHRDSVIAPRDRWVTSWWTQYKMLSWRSLKQTKGLLLQGYAIAQTLVIAIVTGLIYWQIDLNIDTVRDIMGLVFFAVSYWTFNPAFETLTTYPSERAVVSKERTAGSYRLSAYYCAKMTSDLPLTFILPTVMYLLLFIMSGIGGVEEFFLTYCVILLQVLLSQAFGFILGVLFKELKPALTTFVSYSLCAFMIGGFFTQNVPTWLGWAKYLSTMLYSFGVVSTVIFRQMPPTLCNHTSVVEYPQCKMNSTNFIYYTDILENAGIDLKIEYYIFPVFLIIIAFRFIGYFILRIKREKIL